MINMGKIPISQSEAEQRSLTRGIKLVGKFNGILKECEFECPICQNKFKTIARYIFDGKKKKCNNCHSFLYNQQTAEEKSLQVGVKLLGQFNGVETKSLFKCPKCNDEFLEMPIKIWCKQITCCKLCRNTWKLTQKEVKKKFLRKNIILIGRFININIPTEFLCQNCNKIYISKPIDIWNSRNLHCKIKKTAYNRKNIIGQKFNKLLVLEYSHTKGKIVYYLCLCDCGNKHITSGILIRFGKTKSCGHCNPPVVGEKYGHLEIIKVKPSKGIGFRVEYKCKCGNIIECKFTRVKNKKISSCGNCRYYKNGLHTSSVNQRVHKLIGGIHNYKIKEKRYSIDIAIVRQKYKFAIELDSWFWHGHKIEKDEKRYKYLIELGWKVIVVRFGNISQNKIEEISRKIQIEFNNLSNSKNLIAYITFEDWGVGRTYGEVYESSQK